MKSLPRLILFASLATVAYSQSVLYTFDGVWPGDHCGRVSGAGDVNADCVPDFIVGAPLADNTGNNSGSATVYSGSDGSLIWTWDGDSAESEFSNWFPGGVSGAGDVNADGYADLIVGAQLMGLQTRGKARVFSGKTGLELYTFEGNSPKDRLGCSVSCAGDVDGDGHDDVIVGAYLDDNNGPDSGSATVFSGYDGSELWVFDGGGQGDWFGWSVSGAGDVNADGVPDLIVGAPLDNGNGIRSGSATVYSGSNGGPLWTWDGDAPADELGSSVSGAGDVNGDGHADLIVGTWAADINGKNSGMARVYSGLDGGTLYTFYGGRHGVSDSFFVGDVFGWSVSGAGDMNGDGLDDLIVGIPLHDSNGTNSGGARVFSGADGSVIYTFEGDVGDAGSEGEGDWLGFSVSGAGDVNGDGLDDLIVGAPQDDNKGTDSGSAQVFLSRPESGASYCSPAVNNSTGEPGAIRALGLAGAADNEFFLTAYQLPRSTVAQPLFGYFLVSQTQGHLMPPGSDGFLCLGGTIGRFNSHLRPGPTFSMRVDLTDIPIRGGVPVQPGETWNFQAWFRDMNPGSTSNFTDGVSVLFN